MPERGREAKKMVPSDLSYSPLPTGIHGAERRNRKRRTLSPSAPQPPVYPTAGSMPSDTPQASSNRGRTLVKAFPSPATAHFRESMTRSTVPARYFASSLTVSHARSACISTTETGLPRSRRLPRSKPVARSTTRAPDSFLRRRSPSGLLPPYGSKLQRDPPPADPPSEPPDLRSLPESVSISSLASGSTFPVRYVSEACCSSNLLEPFSLCAQSVWASNCFWNSKRFFNNFYLLCFLAT
jgi:hypothetical protein